MLPRFSDNLLLCGDELQGDIRCWFSRFPLLFLEPFVKGTHLNEVNLAACLPGPGERVVIGGLRVVRDNFAGLYVKRLYIESVGAATVFCCSGDDYVLVFSLACLPGKFLQFACADTIHQCQFFNAVVVLRLGDNLHFF